MAGMTDCTMNDDKIYSASFILEKKESPVNPYNRVDWTKMCTKWTSSENEICVVNSLPQLDCNAFPKSYMDTCSCCPRDIFESNLDVMNESYRGAVVGKDEDCCKVKWEKKERYRKIKTKVVRAIKVYIYIYIKDLTLNLNLRWEKLGYYFGRLIRG